jgi:hypothetical protein
VPVAAYWAIMGLLTYGVASGGLRPERLASLHLLPEGSFTSSRLSREPVPDVDEQPLPAPRDTSPTSSPPSTEPAPPGALPTSPAVPTGAPPIAALESSDAADAPPDRGRAARVAPASVRPLSGFSLGAPYEDGEGDRESYGGLAYRDPDDTPAPGASRADKRAVETRTRSTALDPDQAPPARLARRDPLLDREWNAPTPSEFQPARRGSVAMHASDRSKRGAERHDPGDPYPGIPDDDFTPPLPRTAERELPPGSPEQPGLHAPPPPTGAISTCEAVLANENEEMDLTKTASSAPDVTRGAYATVLERGGYLMPCGVPAGMTLDVCAAIRDGRAVGITVVTSPADARVRACVRNAVRAIAFPRSPRLDVTRTRFDRARGR